MSNPYEFIIIDGTLSIYLGKDCDLTIPDSVKKIDSGVFIDHKALESVVIPDSVTEIGSKAFANCISLKKVTVPASVTAIGKDAFLNCPLLAISAPEGSYAEQYAKENGPAKGADGNPSAPEDDFDLFDIVSDFRPEDVSGGEKDDLGQIPPLSDGIAPVAKEEFEISGGVLIRYNGIGADAAIPEGVRKIADDVFAERGHLKRVTIPDSVTEIGMRAFLGCENLENVSIPASVTKIGARAFDACANLVVTSPEDSYALTYAKENKIRFNELLVYVADENGFVVANSVLKRYEGNDTSLVIPNEVKRIAEGVFAGNQNLQSVRIPEGVTEIGAGAFSGCVGLGKVYLPVSVVRIGDFAFADCDQLTVYTNADSYADLYAQNNHIPQKKYKLKDFSIQNGILYQYLGTDSNVDIPDWVTKIADLAFKNRATLRSVHIPDSVTEIGTFAFRECTSLQSVSLPNSIRVIGKEAFCNCSSLAEIRIPDSVIKIGDWAFSGCSALTSIHIPDSATDIGKNVFSDCKKLESLTVGKTNPVYRESGNCLIEIETGTLIMGCKTAKIPNNGSVKKIGSHAFFNSALTSIRIPDSVTVIGESAFAHSALASIQIPDSVTVIEESAFASCSALGNIRLSKSLRAISRSLFSDCVSLTEVSIPDSVNSIGRFAFSGCSALKSLHIPASVKRCEIGAFSRNHALKSITVDEQNPYFSVKGNCLVRTDKSSSMDSVTNKTVLSDTHVMFYWDTFCGMIAPGTLLWGCETSKIPSDGSVTVIAGDSFAGCKALKTLRIPNTVTEIHGSAFSDCSSLEQITLPESLTKIGDYAFSCCTNLKHIRIPNSVRKIEKSLFDRCYSLESVVLPDSVTEIGCHAFMSCSRLNTLYFAGKEACAVDRNAFYGCKNITVITNAGSCAEASMKKQYTPFTLQTVPEKGWDVHSHTLTQYFGDDADVVIPDHIKIIDRYAFVGNHTMRSVRIPSSVHTVKESAFFGCTALEEISIPNSVTEIKGSVFAGCESLKQVFIPSTVIKIAHDAFWGCGEVTVAAPQGSFAAEYAQKLGISLREEANPDLVIRNGVLKKYTEKSTYLATPRSVTEIGSHAFANNESLQTVTVTSSVKKIGAGAFKGCKALKEIVIPESVTEIGGAWLTDAFRGCESLTISAPKGSYAAEYAKKKGIKLKTL